ncbi:GNAT family N-acetyltransferase [Nocardioides coralli]|uniref:GNAT family N-acetyltransferase n=1 Tax=Nocardioides coralli TaxID=2872154 RepID=UPI001CA443B7|nr:GNAT family N-acetyltransferase [Nocardioides coralli]QZY30410.1 GNAT N-acetyltransferase [Nocardioides coralli]
MRFPDDVPRLSDGVVTLRPHVPADIPRVLEQATDPEAVAWTTVPTPYAEADAAAFVQQMVPAGWVQDSSYGFAIECDGRFAGSVDLRVRGSGEAEVGYALHPDARGRGVMRRALDLALDWGFGELGLAVVQWRSHVWNWSSRRAAWAVGFHFGPTVPGLVEQRGRRVDAWTAWIAAGDQREPVEPWLEPPVMEAGPVRLRPWADADAERLVEAANDPVIREWIPETPLPRSAEDVPAYLDRVRLGMATNGRLAWCVADATTDLALGNVAMFEFEEGTGEDDLTAQVGYWSHPAGRGSGAMSAALGAACDWALRRRADGGFGARRLYLLTSARNAASRALAERVGFEHVGTERASAPLPDGGYEDNALYDRVRR